MSGDEANVTTLDGYQAEARRTINRALNDDQRLLDALEDQRAEQATLRMTTELVIRGSTTNPANSPLRRKQRRTQEVLV